MAYNENRSHRAIEFYNSIITKIPVQKFGESMKLKQIADIRTGIVAARKKATDESLFRKSYKMINLKCINEKGYIDFSLAEEFEANEMLSNDFLTQKGDILIRLSVPYTSIIIKKPEEEGYVIPSHFAIIRVDCNLATPEYILWLLRSSKVQQQIRMNNSGSSGFGTISSGFFSNLDIRCPSQQRQKAIGKLLMLSEREQELIYRLSEEKEKYTYAILEVLNNSED